MKGFLHQVFVFAVGIIAALVPSAASAHEAYVLTQDEIAYGIHTAPFSLWAVMTSNFSQFSFWAFIAVLTVFIAFLVGTSRTVERRLDPFLAKLPPYAPLIGRITIGLSFLLAAYYRSLFGPELPLAATFGTLAPFIKVVLVILGIMIIAGWYARIAALVALGLFAFEVSVHGSYMLTYANYLGEILVLLILGSHQIGFHTHRHDALRAPRWLFSLKKHLMPLAFPLLRVAFGVSLLYASMYAKFLHDYLALQVAAMPLAGHAQSLASVLGFEPHFLVLGAGIVEIVIGLFFLLGIEIRFTALFLEFWLTLSLIYFGEVVWPHLILIGIPIAFLCYGYDKYSLEGSFFKRGKREPVL